MLYICESKTPKPLKPMKIKISPNSSFIKCFIKGKYDIIKYVHTYIHTYMHTYIKKK